MALRTITLRGFKSIASLENFEMRNINLLIGANGSGKSNFLSAFKFLANVSYENLQGYVARNGGPDVFLHGGRKKSDVMYMDVEFNKSGDDLGLGTDDPFKYGYAIYLSLTAANTLLIEEECVLLRRGLKLFSQISANKPETVLVRAVEPDRKAVLTLLRSFRQYHFHDTSQSSPIKASWNVDDNIILKEDGSNVSAYLRAISENHPHFYRSIVETIRMVAPFFGDFIFRNGASPTIQLEWHERGDPDTPYSA